MTGEELEGESLQDLPKEESYKKMEDWSLREVAFVDRTRGDVSEFHDLWDAIEDAGYEVAAVQGESDRGFGVFVRDGDES